MIVDLFMWFVIVDFSDAVCDRSCLWVFHCRDVYVVCDCRDVYVAYDCRVVYVVCHCDCLCGLSL